MRETWTILESNERKLEAFHITCQRRIIRIRWFHRVTNAEVTTQTKQENISPVMGCLHDLANFQQYTC